MSSETAGALSVGTRVVLGRRARLFERHQFAIALVAAVMFAGFSLTARNFLTVDNILQITRLVSLWAIVGVGMTFLFIAGEFDLSVGSHFGFLVVLLGILAGVNHWNIWLSAGVILAISLLIGLANGLLTTKVGLPSFIVTLAGWVGLASAALVVSGSWPPTMDNSSLIFRTVTGGQLFEVIPSMTVWMLLIVLAGAFVLARTPFGAHVYATGGNLQAARQAGIATDRVKIVCFVITGGLVGVIALLLVGWLGATPLQTGQGFELQVFAAVILGGTALTGGRGSVLGTFIGAVILGMIYSGLVLLGVQNAWQNVALGLMIVAVASFELLVRRRRRQRA